MVETPEQMTARVQREAEQLFPPLPAAPPTGYFDKVLAQLAASAGSTKGAYATRVVPDLGFRTLSVPGGTIFLGTELLCGFEDEAMLGFVLAREIAHQMSGRVLRRFRALRPRGALTVGFNWGMSLITGGPATLGKRSSESVREVASLGYGPLHEESADAFGINLLVRTGYDPTAAIRVLALLERCDLSSRRALAPFLDVRPVHSRRRMLVSALVSAHTETASVVRVNREAYRRAITRLMRECLHGVGPARGLESRTHEPS